MNTQMQKGRSLMNNMAVQMAVVAIVAVILIALAWKYIW